MAATKSGRRAEPLVLDCGAFALIAGRGLTPSDAKIAFASTSQTGGFGVLSGFVFDDLSYDPKSAMASLDLKGGHSLIVDEHKTPVIMVVSVREGEPVVDVLRRNLSGALSHYRDSLKNKTLWLPLMGTGAGGISNGASLQVTMAALSEGLGEQSGVTVLLSLWHRSSDDEVIQLLGEIPKLAQEFGLDAHELFVPPDSEMASVLRLSRERMDRKVEDQAFDLLAGLDLDEQAMRCVTLARSFYGRSGGASMGDDPFSAFWLLPAIYDVGGLAEEDSPQTWMRREFFLEQEDLRLEMERISQDQAGRALVTPDLGEKDVHPSMTGVLDKAKEIAVALNRSRIGIEDLVAGLIIYQGGIANAALQTYLTPYQATRDGFKQIFLDFLRIRRADQIDTWYSLLRVDPPAFVNAGFAGDDARERKDMLNIKDDIRAFARLIAARRTKPPLAIGVFGDWGSGKSFFMNKLQEEIDAMTLAMRRDHRNALQKDLAYWRHIVQIEFNAWHYVSGNLWASLIHHILMNLSIPETDGSVKKRRDLYGYWMAKINKAKDLQKETESEVVKYNQELDKLAKEDEKLQPIIDSLREQVLSGDIQVHESLKQYLADFDKDSFEQAKTFADQLGVKVDELVDKQQVKQFRELAKDAQDTWNVFKWVAGRARFFLRRAKKFKVRYSLIVILTSALIATAIFGLDWLNYSADLPERLTALILGLAAPVFEYLKFLRKPIKAIANIAEPLQRADQIVTALDGLQKAQHRKEENERQTQQIDRVNYLKEFMDERGARHYEHNLGITSMVRNDLAWLSEAIQMENQKILNDDEAKPFQINRIVLYIDDLDRCPTERVVEVIQAVHLLLAFPLFVVVVAVDARWVEKSLKKTYSELLDEGEVSAHDYLEKIFQIPYWVRGLDAKGAEKLITGLTSDSLALNQHDLEHGDAGFSLSLSGDERGEQVAASPETEVIEQEVEEVNPETSDDLDENDILEELFPWQPSDESLIPSENFAFSTEIDESEIEGESEFEPQADDLEVSKQEQAYMHLLTPLLTRSPRSVNRFVNLYSLIKSWWMGRENSNEFVGKGDSSEYKAVLSLLSVVVGVPNLAGVFFRELQSAKDGETFFGLLEQIVDYVPDKTEFSVELKKDKERLEHFIEVSAARKNTFNTATLGTLKRWAPMISRYAFRPPSRGR